MSRIIQNEGEAKELFTEFWNLLGKNQDRFKKLWNSGFFDINAVELDLIHYTTEKKREALLEEPEIKEVMKKIEFLDIFGKNPQNFTYLWRSSFLTDWKNQISKWM